MRKFPARGIPLIVEASTTLRFVPLMFSPVNFLLTGPLNDVRADSIHIVFVFGKHLGPADLTPCLAVFWGIRREGIHLFIVKDSYTRSMVDAIAHVTVGVADLQAVFELWIDQFSLEVVARRTGPDPDLGRLWEIPAESIADQVLIRTPGAATGWLHFVQFSEPDAPVRAGAAATDLGPKNLDVNCLDMVARYAELQALGYSFRSEIVEYRVGEIHAREVQMPGHDETNIVLLEILSDGFDIEFSPAGYGGVTSFVVIVPDTRLEAAFYREILGLDEIMHHRITGPTIEKVVGLPEGAALDMRLMGREDHIFGRMELIAYEGITGRDRFPLTRAPALGTLHCGFAVESVQKIMARAHRAGLASSEMQNVETIFGTGRMGVLSSPAGLRIEVYQTPKK